MNELNKFAFIQNYIISAVATAGARGTAPPKPHELIDEAEEYWNEFAARYGHTIEGVSGTRQVPHTEGAATVVPNPTVRVEGAGEVELKTTIEHDEPTRPRPLPSRVKK